MIASAHSRWLALTLGFLLCGCGERGENPPRPHTAAQPAQAAATQDTAEQRRTRRLAEVRRLLQSMPRFEAHPVTDTFTGTPAAVDLSSAEGARRFRTVLVDGAAQGPNFAGHYTFVQWGCGSPCQSFAIVDARTGRVTFGNGSLSVGAEYRLDSRLLIADPPERWLQAYGAAATDAIGGNAATTYYRWDGTRLIPLDSLPIGNNVHW